MARGGVNLKEFQELQAKLQRANDERLDKFMEDCAKHLAARLLTKVIKRTPVGIYEAGTGMTGGTLRRGWLATSGREAELTAVFGGGSGVTKFAQQLNVRKQGGKYVIEIINPVEYASYVEYGHRTRNHKNWIKGRFMLSISEREVESASPAMLEKLMKKKLGELFNDK